MSASQISKHLEEQWNRYCEGNAGFTVRIAIDELKDIAKQCTKEKRKIAKLLHHEYGYMGKGIGFNTACGIGRVRAVHALLLLAYCVDVSPSNASNDQIVQLFENLQLEYEQMQNPLITTMKGKKIHQKINKKQQLKQLTNPFITPNHIITSSSTVSSSTSITSTSTSSIVPYALATLRPNSSVHRLLTYVTHYDSSHWIGSTGFQSAILGQHNSVIIYFLTESLTRDLFLQQLNQLSSRGNDFVLDSLRCAEEYLIRRARTPEHRWKAQVSFAALLVPAGLDVHSTRAIYNESIRSFIAEHPRLSTYISILDEAVAAHQRRQVDVLQQWKQAYTSSNSIDDRFPLDNDTAQLVVSYLVT